MDPIGWVGFLRKVHISHRHEPSAPGDLGMKCPSIAWQTQRTAAGNGNVVTPQCPSLPSACAIRKLRVPSQEAFRWSSEIAQIKVQTAAKQAIQVVTVCLSIRCFATHCQRRFTMA